jgi:hypothetical protein
MSSCVRSISVRGGFDGPGEGEAERVVAGVGVEFSDSGAGGLARWSWAGLMVGGGTTGLL